MEDFYTIQGEGFYQGHAAYFIRLGGCDVGCVWCDVKESWDANVHPLVSVEEMVQRAKASGTKLVVITGGEPAMYDLTNLTNSLQKVGLQTNIETSGAYPLTGTWNWVCLSPKKFKSPDPSVFVFANELKIIVYNKSDFAWAEEFAQKVSPSCKLYLQPEWSKEKEMLPQIIEYVKANPKWEVSLQIHKYMNIP
ncbi:MAG TPA: 7-carboxy-7-deazaguanine synthase QueE [Cyclobacteriaceae bacterium]|nr:7-carboxy-7-deazaguanine synthase QueE [Cyclobacteriaceae bacterium]HMV11126.1 7-carboxy-7-deazaguanine synthase QueE [Cyclobacteriaceae bacterium]HMV91363.1 7-carboxy-7-deazaguanine synthase QueE [Cyclobacteriaceae bacterium]HMX02882.1 7-carboxy-7-deazaguanine synthase QueE [Cyclobacteriaceae bacterium]HMX52048.1 7-carboxy-7-deazaguanine synthase QueE [Cyclobacteriaceae bacterium]